MKTFLTLFILLICVFSTKATHIVGGDIHVKWLAPNTYQITLTVFRDCNPGASALTNPLQLGIYQMGTNNVVQTFTVSRDSIVPLQFGDNCFTPTGLCVEKHVFGIDTVVLPDFAAGYYVSAELNARNTSIVNIVNPGGTGITFYAEMPDPALGQNDIPKFGAYPPGAYFCIGVEKELTLNVTDPDGDSLVYSLVDPLDATVTAGAPLTLTNPGPYSPVTWNVGSGFNLANILGAAGSMVVDSATGIISATAATSGIFVFALKVEEFRNGIKIGESRRDIQYAALNCVFDLPPFLVGQAAVYDTLTIFAEEEFCYDVVIKELDPGDSVYVDVQLGSALSNAGATLSHDPNNTYTYVDQSTGLLETVTTNTPVIDPVYGIWVDTTANAIRFCWTPTCEHVDYPFPFTLEYLGFSNGCAGTSDSLKGLIEFNVEPRTEGWSLIPNIFTPNGDGVNDFFTIDGVPDVCNDYMDVVIYNRWGQKVYESSDPYFKWDGKTSNGQPCGSGTYYVIVNGLYGSESISNTNFGTPTKQSSHKFAVTLIRD